MKTNAYELTPLTMRRLGSGMGCVSHLQSAWHVRRRGAPEGDILGSIAYRASDGTLVPGWEIGQWWATLPGSGGDFGPFHMRWAARNFVIRAAAVAAMAQAVEPHARITRAGFLRLLPTYPGYPAGGRQQRADKNSANGVAPVQMDRYR